MRIALISDVHGNLPALEAVLGAADAAGAEELWCLGDLVDWGPHPSECLALLREEADYTVIGNHDLLACGMTDPTIFSDISLEFSAWSRAQLSNDEFSWLSSLPSTLELGAAFLAHASPRDPVWEYVSTRRDAQAVFAACGSRLILVGHTHEQGGWRLRADVDGRPLRELVPRVDSPFDLGDDRWLLNPGSVGFPRHRKDGRAQWLLLDLAAATGELRRETYDWRRTRADLEATPLDPDLARNVRAC